MYRLLDNPSPISQYRAYSDIDFDEHHETHMRYDDTINLGKNQNLSVGGWDHVPKEQLNEDEIAQELVEMYGENLPNIFDELFEQQVAQGFYTCEPET